MLLALLKKQKNCNRINKHSGVLLLGLLTMVPAAFSQDMHFSQFYVSLLPFNPAAAGSIKEDFRTVLMYKDQWRSVTNPYKTLSASYDMRVFKKMGVAVSLFSDRAGASRLTFFQGNLSLSYTVTLDESNFLSAGLQAGYGQKSVNYDELRWDNQFNGSTYDATLSPREKYMNTQFGYGDFAGGLMWSYERGERYATSNDNLKAHAGIALYHVNSPRQSFNDGGMNRQYMKLVLHAGSEIGIANSNTFLLPQLIFFRQGPLQELNAGLLVKRQLGMNSVYTEEKVASGLYLGAFYRLKDAFVAVVRFDYRQKISLGISYDVNVSGLTIASSGRGGMEFSLVYKGFFGGKSPVDISKPSF